MADWTFRIQKSELGKYSTTSVTIDEDLAQYYTSATVERAKELKAKHGSKYTDEYYLDYAKSLQLQDIIGANKEIFKKRLANYEIKDSTWAQYSYEEIIEMEQNGCEIPDNVLEWAHAQQQSDITAYVIVSDGVNADDGSTTEEAVAGDELSVLELRAKKNIQKSEEAIKTTEEQVKEYKKSALKAGMLKRKKEDSYKDSMEEISDMAKEWKELDDKKKNGEKLSLMERLKYMRLGKLLNGSDSKLMKELEKDSTQLNEFLESIDVLNEGISSNYELAQETIQSGKDLSNLEKNYQEAELPYVDTGITFGKNGPSSDTLFGLKNIKVSDLAVERGGDLENCENDVEAYLENPKNVELVEFSQDYTSAAAQTQEKTQNILNGENEEDEEEEAKKKEKESEIKTYNVDMEFTYKNSKNAALTTGKSMVDVIKNQADVKSSDKSLKKELKKVQKDMKTLNKEAAKSEEQHEENLQKEEEYIQQLEDIQGESAGGSTEDKVEDAIKASDEKNDEVSTAQKQQEDIQGAQAVDVPAAERDDKEAEKQSIIDKIIEIDDGDNKVKDKVKKVLSKGIISDAKAQKVNKTLNKENQDLSQRNKNHEQVSQDTLVVGTGTFVKSFITTAIGTTMYTTGVSLMSSPFTYNTGLVLSIAGKKLQEQGQKELKYGTIAIGAGAVGLVAGAAASETGSNAKDTMKEASRIFKSNKQIFKETAKSIGESAEIETGDSQSTEGADATSEETQNGLAQTEQPENSALTEDKIAGNENIDGQTAAAADDTIAVTSETGTQVAGETKQGEDTIQSDEVADNEQQADQTDTVEETEQTENTETTETTNKTEETGDTDKQGETKAAGEDSKEETEDKQQNKKQEQDEKYSVSTEFSTTNAIKAVSTTMSATQDLSNNKSDIDASTSAVADETKKSSTLIKKIEKETSQVENHHENNLLLAGAIVQKFSALKAEKENAQTEEAAYAAQNEMEAASTELDTAIAQDEQTTVVDKSIQASVQQLAKFRNNAKFLDKDITTFDKKISNQLDVSEKTVVVGVGTSGIGVINSAFGANMMAAGMSLMSNPFTFNVGAIQFALGEALLSKGTLEVSSGTLAAATGAAGLIVNGIAKESSTESSAAVKDSDTQFKESDKGVQEAVKALDKSSENVENPAENSDNSEETQTSEEPDIQAQQEVGGEEEEVDETELAAAASVNTNINDTTVTDDKADRKLSRFNIESIIESKKKNKKVLAAFASSNRKSK